MVRLLWSGYLSIYLSIYLPTNQSIYNLSIYQSINLSIYIYIYSCVSCFDLVPDGQV